MEVCREINPNSAHLKYGYLSTMESFSRLPAVDRDIDLLMSGMPSKRREKLVAALCDAGHRTVYPGQPVPVYVRDALMARTSLNLSLQKTNKHQIVSVTRICHSVVNRVPLLLEISTSENEFARFCLTTTGEDIFHDVRAFIDDTDLDMWAEDRYQQLADELPMGTLMADLLAQTIYSRQ